MNSLEGEYYLLVKTEVNSIFIKIKNFASINPRFMAKIEIIC
jgi:hypothetical protein